jgi:heterogeneous nuclear ribonucleoprotein F/H
VHALTVCPSTSFTLKLSPQINFALQKNRQHMGRRYVEVFPTKKADYYRAVAEEVKHGGPIDPPPVQDLGPPRGGFVPGPGGPPPHRGPVRDDRFRDRDLRSRDRSSDRDIRRDYPERNRAPPPARSGPPIAQGPVPDRDGEFSVIKLRGLPYTASKQDIIGFFGEFGLNEDSLHIVTSADGR